MTSATVVGGAMLPHAPQFFTMPETEDAENVAGGPRRCQPASANDCAR